MVDIRSTFNFGISNDLEKFSGRTLTITGEDTRAGKSVQLVLVGVVHWYQCDASDLGVIRLAFKLSAGGPL